MAYFCNGCLEYWENKNFMDGCKECKHMKIGWGNTTEESAIMAQEVWGPIVAWCKKHKIKAWVKQPNDYDTRLPFTGVTVAVPCGKDSFWKQQAEFVKIYNKFPTEEHWNILHPETQRQSQLRF